MGALFGFFFTVKFGAASVIETANYAGAEDVAAFFKADTKAPASFGEGAVSGYINSAIFADFKLKNKAHGYTLQTPIFVFKNSQAEAALDVLAPILGASQLRRLSFFAEVKDEKLELTAAKFGDAKIPLFIAKLVYKNIAKDYFKGANLAIASENLANCKVLKLDNGTITISK